MQKKCMKYEKKVGNILVVRKKAVPLHSLSETPRQSSLAVESSSARNKGLDIEIAIFERFRIKQEK